MMEAQSVAEDQPQAPKQLAEQKCQIDKLVVTSSLEDAKRILYDYEMETTTKFCMRRKIGQFGEAIDLEKLVLRGKMCVQYHLKTSFTEETIEEGLPLIILGRRYYDCMHGFDRWAGTKRKRQKELQQHEPAKPKKIHSQGSRKFDCPCRIVMIDVLVFPDQKLEIDTQGRRRRRSMKIRKFFRTYRTERRVYVQLPQVDHHNHPTGQAAGVSLTVDKRVTNAIKEYCQKKGPGVSAKEAQSYAEYFVKSKLFPDGNCPPRNNRRFFPKLRDVLNHMYYAKQTRFKEHQSSLETKVEEWKDNSSMKDDFLFFRKENEASARTSSVHNSRLLYIHQTKAQQRLLQLYGNEITLLDAAYKTTRYDMPLFLLVVPTNCDYQIVCEFVVAKDKYETIEEALRVIRSHNPNWYPKWWMLDHSDEQTKAVESVFHESQVFVCDFHREQAWERWLNKSSNQMKQYKDTLLTKMRRLAQARTDKEFTQVLQVLKASYEWNVDDAKMFRQWFTNTWIKTHEKWVWAYRDQQMMPSMNTSKGMESQSKALRHQYLEKRRHLSLTDILTCIVEEYIPTKYACYVSNNSIWSAQYRKYSTELDPILHERPRPFLDHCKKCITEAEDIPSYKIHQSYDDALFSVGYNGSDGSEYSHRVDLSKPSCTCNDFKNTGWPCKHMFVIFARCSGWHMERLPGAYLDSPFLNIDRDIVFTDPYEGNDNTYAMEDIVIFTDEFDGDDTTVETDPIEDFESTETIAFEPGVSQSPPCKRKKQTEATKFEASIKKLLNLSYTVTDPAALKQARLLVDSAVKVFTNHLETEGAISSILTH